MGKFADPDPVEALATALGQTVALKGHAKVYGDGDQAKQTSLPRIVLDPTGGPCNGRVKAPAFFDIDLTVRAAIWAESRSHAWALMVRLAQGIREHGSSATNTGPLCPFTSVEFDPSDDTGAQGAAIAVRFVMHALPVGPPTAATGLISATSLERTDPP